MIIRIKKALKAFWDNLTYPRMSTKLDAMDCFDHKHICLAFRLLDINDFKKVCPIKNLTPNNPEWDANCDHCPCQAILSLRKSSHIPNDKVCMELVIPAYYGDISVASIRLVHSTYLKDMMD